MQPADLWMTEDRSRYFLIPNGSTLLPGVTSITTLQGSRANVDESGLECFEVSEEQARRLVKEQLGEAFTELRDGLNETLADWRKSLDAFNRRPVDQDTSITPEAPAAILDFLRQLPRVVGQSVSGDEACVGAARDAMRELQQRLKDAGIDVGDRMRDFPDRLVTLRQAVKEPREG